MSYGSRGHDFCDPLYILSTVFSLFEKQLVFLKAPIPPFFIILLFLCFPSLFHAHIQLVPNSSTHLAPRGETGGGQPS